MDGLAGLQAWENEHGGLITIALGVLGLLAALFVGAKARDGFPSWGERLQDTASWPALITRFRRTAAQTYDAAVADLLTFADWLYGPHPISGRAFNRCLQLALFYPLISVLLGWVLFNTHSPAGLDLFVDEPLFWLRIGRTLALLAALALSTWIVANAQKFADFVVDRLFGPFDEPPVRPGVLSNADTADVKSVAVFFVFVVAAAFALVVALVVAFVVAFVIAFDFAVAFVFVFVFVIAFALVAGLAVLSAIAGALAVANAGAGALVVAGVVIFAGVFASAVAVAGAGAFSFVANDPATAALILFFYVFLPVLNAVADWISLAITRRFLRANPEGHDRALSLILLRAVFDLALALICLGGLLCAVTYGLALWGDISPATLPFTAAEYMAQVVADPRQGTALYLMVATTLLPTFLHFLLGLGAVLSQRGRILARVADELEDKQASGKPLTAEERHSLVGKIRQARWVGYGAALGITAVIFALVIWPILRLAF